MSSITEPFFYPVFVRKLEAIIQPNHVTFQWPVLTTKRVKHFATYRQSICGANLQPKQIAKFYCNADAHHQSVLKAKFVLYAWPKQIAIYQPIFKAEFIKYVCSNHVSIVHPFFVFVQQSFSFCQSKCVVNWPAVIKAYFSANNASNGHP